MCETARIVIGLAALALAQSSNAQDPTLRLDRVCLIREVSAGVT
jgi:hypothetical protein